MINLQNLLNIYLYFINFYNFIKFPTKTLQINLILSYLMFKND